MYRYERTFAMVTVILMAVQLLFLYYLFLIHNFFIAFAPEHGYHV